MRLSTSGVANPSSRRKWSARGAEELRAGGGEPARMVALSSAWSTPISDNDSPSTTWKRSPGDRRH